VLKTSLSKDGEAELQDALHGGGTSLAQTGPAAARTDRQKIAVGAAYCRDAAS